MLIRFDSLRTLILIAIISKKKFQKFTFFSPEYLLGDKILVAPVIEQGKTSRSIYLPEGRWMDGNNNENIYDGKMWLDDYPAPLDTLPYFIRAQIKIDEE